MGAFPFQTAICLLDWVPPGASPDGDRLTLSPGLVPGGDASDREAYALLCSGATTPAASPPAFFI